MFLPETTELTFSLARFLTSRPVYDLSRERHVTILANIILLAETESECLTVTFRPHGDGLLVAGLFFIDYPPSWEKIPPVEDPGLRRDPLGEQGWLSW